MTNSFKDYRGNIIQRGTKVAYNKSGEVVIGIVTELEIKPRKHRWNPFEYTIRVRMLGGDGAFSTVKNHLCIVSIQGE